LQELIQLDLVSTDVTDENATCARYAHGAMRRRSSALRHCSGNPAGVQIGGVTRSRSVMLSRTSVFGPLAGRVGLRGSAMALTRSGVIVLQAMILNANLT